VTEETASMASLAGNAAISPRAMQLSNDPHFPPGFLPISFSTSLTMLRSTNWFRSGSGFPWGPAELMRAAGRQPLCLFRDQRELHALLAFQWHERPAAAPHGVRTGFITSARWLANNQEDIPRATYISF